MNFFTNNLHLLIEKLAEQIYLVALSSVLAIFIGVTAGIFVTRFKKLKPPVISIANILQTIPSIALLGFLLPFFGIGITPAIIALTVYAILPVLRNTISGIENVPTANKQAAMALGFTTQQQLRLVELPLALPVMMAGIRTAVVMSTGIATIAAFIGAGGLGDFIYQGLAINNNSYILLGAIPAALLALILDFGLSHIEKRFTSRKKRPFKLNRFIAAIALSFIIALAIKTFFLTDKKQNTITIGTKNFTEQLILGNIMADMIESRTQLKVIKKFNLGTTSMLQAAITKGDIDIYPEYTGTAFLTTLKEKYNPSITKDELYKTVKTQYLHRFNLIWLKPFGFNNSDGLMVEANFSKTNGINNISDLHKIRNLTIAAPQDFIKRPDGLIGLQKIYHLHFKAIKPMVPELTFQAIKQHDVNVIVGFTTDGKIRAYHLKVLADNKHLYPSYLAAPIIRKATLEKFPQIKHALAPLAGLINNNTMQHLNYLVSIKQETPSFVARQFLQQKKLLTSK